MYAEQQGLATLLVDLDSISSTTSEWAAVREAGKSLVMTAQLADVEALCDQAIAEGFDLLILDFPPYFSDDVLAAIVIVDRVLIPISPRFPELQSLPKYIDAVEHDHSIVLNTCSDEEAEAIRGMLVENGSVVSDVHISRLDCFAEAMNSGSGASEIEPDGKAARQIRELFENHVLPS